MMAKQVMHIITNLILISTAIAAPCFFSAEIIDEPKVYEGVIPRVVPTLNSTI